MNTFKSFILTIGLFAISKSQNKFLPNLPLGVYRLLFDAMYPCGSPKNHTYEANLYLYRKSSNVTEVRGNVTLKKPFDDTYKLDMSLSSWSLRGGWKENALVVRTEKACSSLKSALGNLWPKIWNNLKVSNSNCPVTEGIYVLQGFDVKYLEEAHNFTKVYFYGKYKAFIKARDKKNNLLGCLAVELRVVRPWEVTVN